MRQLLRTYVKDLNCKSETHQHYQQLTEIIKKRAKDNACATLFAKPIGNVQDGYIEWYTTVKGDIINLSEATEEQAELFWNKYEIIDEKLEQVKESLHRTQRKGAQDNAARLDQMRNYPGSMDYLFLVGQEPVIAAWGCGSAPIIPPAERLAKPMIKPKVSPPLESVISKETPKQKDESEKQPQGPAAPPLPPPPEAGSQVKDSVSRKKRIGIWWLLSAIVFIIICILLFARCANQKIIPIETDKEKVDTLALQADELRKDIDNLKNRLMAAWSECPDCQNMNSDSVQRRLNEYLPNLAPSNISISLVWNTYHDLDLHVFSPKGDHIYFRNKFDRYGGRLNIDFNNRKNPQSFSRRPIENITWPENSAPSGVYTVQIMLYDMDLRDAQINPIPYLVTITVNGKENEFKGAVPFHKKGKYHLIHKFRVD